MTPLPPLPSVPPLPLVLAFGFGSPWLLLGVLLAGIPVLLHLLFRRQHREEPFAANRFLAEAARKHSRRIRFQQWVLLAVRVSVLLLVAISLARPYLDTDDGGSGGPGPEITTHHVLVIDASLSMRHVHGGLSRFDRGRGLLSRLVEDTHVGDTFRLLTIRTARGPLVIGQAAGRRADVLEELRRLEPTHEPADLLATLQAAADLLQPPRTAGHWQVAVVSDFQQADWQPGSGPAGGRLKGLLATIDRHADLVLYDIGGPQAENTAVVGFSSDTPVAVAGMPLRLRASLRHFGITGGGEQRIELYIDDRLAARRSVSLVPGRTVDVEFPHRFATAGEHRLEVRLAGDALPDDDRRFLSLPVRDRLAVLLVGGRYAGRPEDEATYYLQTALEPATRGTPASGGKRAIGAVKIAERDLGREDLGRYDCVVLCDVARLDSVEVKKLSRFVNAGGGLILGMGSRVDPDAWNRTLGEAGLALLPGVLERVVEPSESPRGAFVFDPGGYTHPLLHEFRGVAGNGLATTLTLRYLRSRPLPESRVAMKFDTGDPAVLTRSVGHGRVVLVTTSLDDRWSTWPVLSPSYLPMVHELVSFATSGRWSNRQGLVGETIRRPAGDAGGGGGGQITMPSDTQQAIDAGVSGEPSSLEFSETFEPGIYRLEVGRPAERIELFAVNVDTRESDLAAVASEDLTDGLLSGLRAKVRTDWQPLDAPASTTQLTDPLSRHLLGLLLGLLLVELVMAWRFEAGAVLLVSLVAACVAGGLWGIIVAVLTGLLAATLTIAWHNRYGRQMLRG